MRQILLMLLLFWSVFVNAKSITTEFSFTPFVGDHLKSPHVEIVPGKVEVFLNNVPIVIDEIKQKTVQVLFDDRQIAAPLWMPMNLMGPSLRRGNNILRIEFEPTNNQLLYSAQLRWATITDTVIEKQSQNSVSATNQTNKESELKSTKGRVILERPFEANFAKDRPWHHYLPVKILTVEDKQALTNLVNNRIEVYKPNFGKLYELLNTIENFNVAEIQNAKCLDKAYAAGVRVQPPASEQLEFITTGNAEIVIRRQGKIPLYNFVIPESLKKAKNSDFMWCASMALSQIYPPRLVFVRTPTGVWEAIH